ncbi:hypothetical protein GDO81_020930, partial [Engystomops pustulosus]
MTSAAAPSLTLEEGGDRSESPAPALTQGTEPGASQDEAMFVHAQSYEDLSGEVEGPGSPEPQGESLEEISQDFSNLSTQLSHEETPECEDPLPPADGGARALDDWYHHHKHVFVLSEAGKPVYSRYQSEEALSSTAGVMMALVSFLETGKNAIRSIHAGTGAQGPLHWGKL